jgi:spore coat protein H
MKRTSSLLMILVLLASLLAACSQSNTPSSSDSSAPSSTDATATPTQSSNSNVQRPANWNETSHGDSVEPNYAVVFPEDKVNEITITISPEQWAAMQADMVELLGEPGSGGGFGGRGGPGGGRPGGGGGPGGGGMNINFTERNPIWVEADISFNGETWSKVGVRYKGNSSLSSAWRSGDDKIPLKLDFDEFEDQYPELKNQRFYGFKQLSLANGFSDATYMRDALTSDLLERAGLPVAKTAFYNLTLDYGEGPVNLGIYTAIEVVDDTVVERYFGDDSGNLYEGNGNSLAKGSFDTISEGYEKKNNEKTSDWSDIEELYNILHSDLRTSDPAEWRKQLEAVFDVDGFLEWLAISAAIQHGDTYGGLAAHNYYIYHNPATDQLTWISWDHNMVLGSSPGGRGGPGGFPGGDMPAPPEGGFPGGGQNSERPQMPEGGFPDGGFPDGGQGGERPQMPEGGFPGGGQNGERPQMPQGGFGGGQGFGGFGSGSLDRANTSENWPLIRFLLDDETYNAQYINAFRELVGENGAFDSELMLKQYNQWADLLAPYIAATGETDTFNAAVEALKTQTTSRYQAVVDFLAK